jgi:hypothetical protein
VKDEAFKEPSVFFTVCHGFPLPVSVIPAPLLRNSFAMEGGKVAVPQFVIPAKTCVAGREPESRNL